MSPESRTSGSSQTKGPNVFQITYQILRKGFLEFFMNQIRTRGELARLSIRGKDIVLVANPDCAREILLTNRQNFDKLATWESSREILLGDGLIAAHGAQWKRQRRLMASYFTPKSIEAYFHLMLEAAEAESERWQIYAKAGEAVDLQTEMTHLTAWIILKSMFGAEISDQRLQDLAKDVEIMILFGNLRNTFPIEVPLWLPLPSHIRYRNARGRVHNFIREVIERRRNQPQSNWPRDLLSQLMSARDEETGESMADLLVRDECLGIFIAGHETTARTMTFLWHSLQQNPQAAARLRQELDDVISLDEPLTVEQLKQAPYLLQVIKEVLRLYPPAPAYPRDTISPQVLGDTQLESGSMVMLFPYATHRDPNYWNDPEQFDPDRFTEEREAEIHPYAYYPFGGGNRICMGNSFAMLEMSVLAAVLVHRFEPKMVPNHQPKIDMKGGTLSILNGLPMIINQRGS